IVYILPAIQYAKLSAQFLTSSRNEGGKTVPTVLSRLGGRTSSPSARASSAKRRKLSLFYSSCPL
ncbi:hypothetical protein L914_13727, partial [Phytophthora nicotianae]